MSRIIDYISKAYPQFTKHLSTHTMYETRQKYAHIMPIIKADVLSFAKENNINLDLNI